MYSFSKYKEQYKQTLRLALPVVLAQLGQIAVQIADNVMVGRYGGEDAVPLAAVSFGNSVFFLFFIAAIGITFGLTPLIGERYAQGRAKDAARLFQSGISLYFIIGLVTMLALVLFTPLLYHMGQPTEVVDMALPYYRYLLLSMPFVMLFYGFKQFLEGVGNTRAQMFTTITSNILNIGLNWLLIYGHWGLPEMGAEGAGLATFISRVVMPLILVGYVIRHHNYRRYLMEFNPLHLPKREVQTLLKIGVPISLQVTLESAAFVISGIMMGWFSTAAISANQITTTMANTAFHIVMAIGVAVTIRVSHNYGAKNLEQIRLTMKSSYHLTLVWNALAALLFVVFRYEIARMFTSNPEVIELTARLMPFIALFQLSDGIQNVSIGVLRGLQYVKVIFPIALVSYLLLNLPIGYLLGFTFGMGPEGLVLALTIGLSTAGLLAILCIRHRMALLEKSFHE